jgi:hypothetical protein
MRRAQGLTVTRPPKFRAKSRSAGPPWLTFGGLAPDDLTLANRSAQKTPSQVHNSCTAVSPLVAGRLKFVA